MEALAQPIARRDVLDPEIDFCLRFGNTAWPQSIDQNACAVVGMRRLIDALEYERGHAASPNIRAMQQSMDGRILPRRHQSMKRFDEPINVVLVIIDVRADAQPTKAWSDVNVFGGETLYQLFRHAIAEAEA